MIRSAVTAPQNTKCEHGKAAAEEFRNDEKMMEMSVISLLRTCSRADVETSGLFGSKGFIVAMKWSKGEGFKCSVY